MSAPGEYILGQTVVMESDVTDPAAADAPAADALIVLTVYRPDTTTETPVLTQSPTGTYTGQITTNQAGWWEYVFLGAGAGRGRFYVSPVP